MLYFKELSIKSSSKSTFIHITFSKIFLYDPFNFILPTTSGTHNDLAGVRIAIYPLHTTGSCYHVSHPYTFFALNSNILPLKQIASMYLPYIQQTGRRTKKKSVEIFSIFGLLPMFFVFFMNYDYEIL
jgi:hypothetical protein